MGTKRRLVGTNEQLLAAVIAEINRLATGDIAPSIRQWDAQRTPGLPAECNIRKRLGLRWTELVAMTGLKPTPSIAHVKPGLAADIDSAVSAGATVATWFDRFCSALHVLPAPTRTETLVGRTIAGDPCLIRREYRMVR